MLDGYNGEKNIAASPKISGNDVVFDASIGFPNFIASIGG